MKEASDGSAASTSPEPLTQLEQALRIHSLEADNADLKARLAALESQYELDLGHPAPTPAPSPPSPSLDAADVLEQRTVGTLTIPEQSFEDFALVAALLSMMLIASLPFWSCWARRCETKRHKIFPFLIVIDLIIFVLLMNSMYLVNINTVFFLGVKIFEVMLGSVETLLTDVGAVVALFVAWKFKDRILAFLGVDSAALIFGDFRDWATCWSMKRFHAMEIYFLKVEGLPNASLARDNNVYCEALLGYNLQMRTRVHARGGNHCIFKESVQLNFDPWDTTSKLKLVVKHQGLMNEEICSVQIPTGKVREMEQSASSLAMMNSLSTRMNGSFWDPSNFTAFEMLPAGKLWLRFVPVQQEERQTSFWECCCGCLFGKREDEVQQTWSDSALLAAERP
mmetsp:Transcript_74450/g.155206  ORF Transcript_74450/g.155206 Transcript_74450/m.155206 type:complete len:396 (+) Transcript_74450:203-1390(+)